MIDWCVANGFTPVMVFPPLSKEFSGLFGTKFCENYLAGFYKAIDRSSTPYYDYAGQGGGGGRISQMGFV